MNVKSLLLHLEMKMFDPGILNIIKRSKHKDSIMEKLCLMGKMMKSLNMHYIL